MIHSDACRIALEVSYVGTNYSGLQRLKQADSINNRLEAALSGVADHPVKLYAASRTDKGVHALQQVLHFDTKAKRENHKWCAGGNANLPKDIRIHWAKAVDPAFHARFCAQSRRYAYLIANCEGVDAAMQGLCYSLSCPLDLIAMSEASALISGENDCVAFTTHKSILRASGKSTIRHIDWIAIHLSPPWVLIDIQANAFLHRMVRMLVAELIQIGLGKYPVDHLHKLLLSGRPRDKKTVVPATGLFLAAIGYSSVWNLPLKTADSWPYRLVKS